MNPRPILKRKRIKIRKPFADGSYAIVRRDMPSAEWWDGYYSVAWAQMMADWWSKTLGVQCFVMEAKYPELPDSGYHAERRPREEREAQLFTVETT